MSRAPSSTRDGSQDRAESRMVKHQHTYSESNGRSSVPMWDSSDPDRAPPPLPLNPSINNSPITKPNVSSTIEKAAALIASRALESAPSAYTSNPPPTSPIKEIIKPHHRRMQTLQTGAVGRLSDSIERRSPEKCLRSSRFADFEEGSQTIRTPEQSPTRLSAETPTPLSRSNKQIVDENTPPAPDMSSLQSTRGRQEPEAPLFDITNGGSRGQNMPSMDILSSQILNITNIATNLQKELSSLTKRSKDNSSDLLKLQEATRSRDEDIRKSLRDLVSGIDHKIGSIDTRLLGAPDASKSAPNLSLFLEDHEHTTPSRKSFTLPRITSPVNFLASELSNSPSVVSVDGAASIAMLEKVLREMATKDGQDKLMNTMKKVKTSAADESSTTTMANTAIDPSMMQKLEEILVFMKDMKADSGSKALIRAPSTTERPRGVSQMDLYLDEHKRSTTAENINDEVVKTLRSVKQSLSQHGGLTNEVKALVRELRGEVLGMGREIARKLDQAPSTSRDLAVAPAPNQDHISQVVGQSLADLKEHMNAITQENASRLSRTPTTQPDADEIVAIIRQAISDAHPVQQPVSRDFTAEREEMIAAVKEAWEECKPEIALEHFGLERDEILVTLKEGLQSYQPQHTEMQASDVIHEQVLEAVQKGLADYRPPSIEQQPSLTKDDVFVVVQECLAKFEFPPHLRSTPLPAESNVSDLSREVVLDAVHEGLSKHSALSRSHDLSRDDVLDTLREGLQTHQPTVAKEIEFNREDLFDAIKACLEGEQNPLGGMGERVVETMHEFFAGMKTEFQEYSAANGRDTEQVLDAVKDGLEELRGEIESYVDRAADVTGKDEIIDVVKSGFAAMQVDMDKGFASRNAEALNTPELLDAMEKEFEHLRETLRKTLTNADVSADKNQILDAIRDISDDRGSVISASNEDIARLVKDEFEHIRIKLEGTLSKGTSTLDREEVLEVIRVGLEGGRSAPRHDGNESLFSNTSELLDAFQDGVDHIRADMQKLKGDSKDTSKVEEILDTLKTSVDDIRCDIQALKSSQQGDNNNEHVRGQEVMLHDENGVSAQLESLKVMITQLRIKVEAMDMPAPEVVMPTKMRVHPEDLEGIHAAMDQHVRKEDISELHTVLQGMHDSIIGIPREMPAPVISLPEILMPANAVCKDDTDAIETLLHNIRARLDEITPLDIESVVKSAQVDTLEVMLKDIRTKLDEQTLRTGEGNNKEDFTMIELSLKDIASNLEVLRDRNDSLACGDTALTKTDLEVLESLCLDIKSKVDEQQPSFPESAITKDDIAELKDGLKSFREQLESDNDLTAQAFEARKIEHGGLANKMDTIKDLVANLKEECIGKLSGNEEGIVELSKVLGMHHDNMETYATAASITELTELVTKAFDAHIDMKASNKAETEERDTTLFSKLEDTNAELKLSIEEKFNDLMLKYDDAQLANESKLKDMEARDKEHLDTNGDVKNVVKDIKGLMDTLGVTVSNTCEKITEDSRTVFDIVDQSNIKVTELTASNAQEHSITREEISRTFDAAIRLEGSLQHQHPVVLAAIQEILDKVTNHFEHSKQQSETLREATEEIKTGVRDIPAAIPPLLPLLPAVESAPTIISDNPGPDKYEGAEVHAKLDELLSHTALARDAYATMDSHHTSTQERLAGLDRIDDIHEKVAATAEEISAMVATQTRLMTDHHNSQAEAAREAAVALEKRTAQKEHVEADIVALTEEKNVLIEQMMLLKREHAELFAQTKRLTREVGKLETALSIRQEEMRDMNVRAETLERRVLEGVMNHARSMKIARPMPKKKKISPAERDASMNVKRVPSVASTATTRPSARTPSALGSAVGMALKKRTPLTQNANGSSRVSAADRRILSQSYMQNGQSKGANRALVLAPSGNPSGLVSLKRSQSVKSNPSTYLSGRKPSWTGNESLLVDKENHTQDPMDEDFDDNTSDTGTERRTSLSGTSYMYTDSQLSRDTGRSTSYASTMSGMRDHHHRGRDSILEEDEDDEEIEIEHDGGGMSNAMILTEPIEVHDYAENLDHDHDSSGSDSSDGEDDFEDADTIGDLPTAGAILHHEAKYAVPSDSGLGTEPSTPDVSLKGGHVWHSGVSTTT